MAKTIPPCTSPGPACPTRRIWSRRANRFFWRCACGRAFADDGGKQATEPLRGQPDPAVKCPSCGAPMVRVTGAVNGDFWSCSAWPKCQGTREMEAEK